MFATTILTVVQTIAGETVGVPKYWANIRIWRWMRENQYDEERKSHCNGVVGVLILSEI